MSKYKVPIDSYDSFRRETFGKLYDIDGVYGSQCWDGAALLWSQPPMSRTLKAGGTGAARGCYEVESARKENAGTEFDVISDITQIKRGDIIVYGAKLDSYGHIGFADEDYPASKPTIATYGENQGGTGGKGLGAAFSVKSYNKSALVGAFRFKAWASSGKSAAVPVSATTGAKTYTVVKGDTMSSIAQRFGMKLAALVAANPNVSNPNIIHVGQVLNIPATAVQSVSSALKSIDEIAKEVVRGKWGNGSERVRALTQAGYDAVAVQKRVNEMLK